MSSALPTSLDTLSDEELASRALKGAREAFNHLAIRHETRLFRFLSKNAANTSDVEDAMQQAMVKAYVNLHRYDSRWKFTTWLYTIALRELRTIGRRAGAGPRMSSMDQAQHLTDSGAGDAAGQLAARDDGADMWALAKRVLNPQQYTALWLRFGEDLAPREVARVMRRPRIWVSVTLHRACAALREIADQQADRPGIAGESHGAGKSNGAGTSHGGETDRKTRPPRERAAGGVS